MTNRALNTAQSLEPAAIYGAALIGLAGPDSPGDSPGYAQPEIRSVAGSGRLESRSPMRFRRRSLKHLPVTGSGLARDNSLPESFSASVAADTAQSARLLHMWLEKRLSQRGIKDANAGSDSQPVQRMPHPVRPGAHTRARNGQANLSGRRRAAILLMALGEDVARELLP